MLRKSVLAESEVEPAYREAARLISPYASAFSGMTGGEFWLIRNRIASLLTPPSHLPFSEWPRYAFVTDISGLFLSAVLNCTDLEAIAGVFDQVPYLGYRLEKGKLLVIRPGSDIKSPGLDFQGIIVNNSSYIAPRGMNGSGLLINYGKIMNLFGSRFSDDPSEYIGNNSEEILITYDGNIELVVERHSAVSRIPVPNLEIRRPIQPSAKETKRFRSLRKKALDSAMSLAWLLDNPDFDLADYPPAYWRGKDAELKGILNELNKAVVGYRGK